MPFEPKASDIQWVANTIGCVKNGGTWEIPMTGQKVTINHVDRQLIFHGAENELVHRTRVIAERLEPPYTVCVRGFDVIVADLTGLGSGPGKHQ